MTIIERSLEDARAIGAGSSRRDDAPRWTEVIIHALPDGRFAIENVGKSIVAGETDRRTVTVADTPQDVVTMLLRGKRRPSVAVAGALRAAALYDPRFGDDAFVIAQSTTTKGSYAVELTRAAGDRSIRFSGRAIAHVTSRSPQKRVWSEATIFRVDGGGYAVDLRTNAEDEATEILDDRAKVAIVATAREVLEALTIGGGLTNTGWSVLRAATENDGAFAAELGDCNLRAFARWSVVERYSTPTGRRRRHFVGIMLARVSTHAPTTTMYRTFSPRTGVGYLVTIEVPGEQLVDVCSLRSPIDVRPLPHGEALLQRAALRDLDVARAVRAAGIAVPTPALPATPSDDPLDATRPRSSSSAIPPPWE